MSHQQSVWGSFRRFLHNSLGVRGRHNLVSWAVAGGLAYYLFYLPEQRKAEQIKLQRQLAKERAVELGLVEVDKARPKADPQDTGLIKGIGAVRKAEAARAANAGAGAADAASQQ